MSSSSPLDILVGVLTDLGTGLGEARVEGAEQRRALRDLLLSKLETMRAEHRADFDATATRLDRVERTVHERGVQLGRVVAAVERIAAVEERAERRAEAAEEARAALVLAGVEGDYEAERLRMEARREVSNGRQEWLVRFWRAPGVQVAVGVFIAAVLGWVASRLGVAP
jgi:AcrR family transcriptional regulator